MNSLSPLRIHNDTLIPLVEKRPVLWDTSLEVPKRKKAKRKAWKEVCRELYADFDDMEDEERDEYVNGVKQRWQCLHDTFLNKKEEETLNKSGSGLKKYIYAEKLHFLDRISSSVEKDRNVDKLSEEKSTPNLAMGKIAKELVSQVEKLDNSESHECKFIESPKGALNDKTPKYIFSNIMQETESSNQLPEIRFSDKLPEHRSPVKEAQDKGVSEKTDCLKPFKELQSNGIDPESLSDNKQSKDIYASESHSQKLTDDFHKDVLTDSRPKNPFESSQSDFWDDDEFFNSPESESSDDLPEDEISEKLHDKSSDVLLKDRNVDKLSEDKSTSKPVSSKVARKLVFPKRTKNPKTSKKSKGVKSQCPSTEPSAAESTEDLFTDEPSTDRFSKKRLYNASTNSQFVAKKLCNQESIEELSKNRLVDELLKGESTPKSVSRDIVNKQPIRDRLCKNKSPAQLSKCKSPRSPAQSSKGKSPQSPAQLPKGKSQENLAKESCVDQPSKNDKLSKHRSTKKSSNDKLSRKSSKDKSSRKSSKDKSSRKSSKDKSSRKSSKDKSSRKSSKDRFTDISTTNNFTNEPSKTDFASNPSNDGFTEKNPVPEREDIVHQTNTTKQRTTHNYLSSQGSGPERINNFNLFINSVMPHLNSFDESETLDFQIGVLRVLQVIQHTRNSSQVHPPIQFPQQFLEPETLAISESGLL